MSRIQGWLHKKQARDAPEAETQPEAPAQSASVAWFMSDDARATLAVPGYTRLADNPEVLTGMRWIADRVSSMTIHLMENSANGAARVQDELSRKIDINPNPNMTRKTFMSAIVRTLLLEGSGNQITIPVTKNGLLESLEPIPASRVSFADMPGGYRVIIGGQSLSPSDVLHFVLNPDPDRPYLGTGIRIALRDVVRNLQQAAETRRGFMSTEWKPSIVIRLTDAPDLTPENRERILKEYASSSKAGQPWLLDANLMNIETIKPLSLQDLAINDSITLDKKTVAGMLGVPLYAVGAGPFNREEHNNAVRSVIMNVAQAIQQEMTRKILISPNRYFRFNPRSLYAYEITELARIGGSLSAQGLITGNEARDWIGMPPHPALDELHILENYVPRDMIGSQEKLQGGENNADGAE